MKTKDLVILLTLSLLFFLPLSITPAVCYAEGEGGEEGGGEQSEEQKQTENETGQKVGQDTAEAYVDNQGVDGNASEMDFTQSSSGDLSGGPTGNGDPNATGEPAQMADTANQGKVTYTPSRVMPGEENAAGGPNASNEFFGRSSARPLSGTGSASAQGNGGNATGAQPYGPWKSFWR